MNLPSIWRSCLVRRVSISSRWDSLMVSSALWWSRRWSDIYKEGRKEMFYLTTSWTHFIYGDMASDIWLRTILIVRKETRCHHIGYSFRLTASVLLHAPSHRQDSTYHSLCYTSRGTLAGTGNSSMGPRHEGSIRWPIASWAKALTTELHLTPIYKEDSVCQNKTCQPVTLQCHPNFIAHTRVCSWWDGAFTHGGMDCGPIELFLIPASVPRLV